MLKETVGGRPTASHFWLRHNLKVSLHRNFVVLFTKKVTQRRRSPVYRPYGVPSKNAIKRGCGTRAMRSDSPRLPLRMIAIFLGGAQGKVNQKQNHKRSSVRTAHTKPKKQNMWAFAHTRPSILLKPLLTSAFNTPHPPPSSAG